jgi:hypothetical protein
MTRKSSSTKLLAIALLFSVALSHLYGAWHGVAHFEHKVHSDSHASHVVTAAFDSIVLSSTAKDLVAQFSALKADCEEHSEHEPQHSCVSLDGLCSGLTPVSGGLTCLITPIPTVFLVVAFPSRRAHLAWAHASARAPPGISIA